MLTGSGVTIDTNSIYAVTVGAGGIGRANGDSPSNGTNSSFSIVSTASVGGGCGGIYNGFVGQAGGSGGGGSSGGIFSSAGGAGTSGQGNAGGTGVNSGAAGGGGAGAVGANGTFSVGGAGGIGLTSSINGTSTYYAGGGAGAGTVTQASGGLGGGGNSIFSGTAGAGTANTGGGGGGSWSNTGGNGGSGIVIISYAGSTQLMAGGTVTISGGNVIHTFTSSGYLTPIDLVGNSLRFRSSASAYLSRTPTNAATSTTKGTISLWFKGIGQNQNYLIGKQSGTIFYLYFNSSNQLVWQNGGVNTFITTQVFRDPAAWYHLVASWDTTQANSSNRQALYLNGQQITAFGTTNNLGLNAVVSWFDNDGNNRGIGSYISGGFFDGYMTEINAIDGQALTPNSFGTFNSFGVWQPITYGGSYGTNGFYLPFTGSSSYVGSFTPNQYLSMSSSAFAVGTSNFTIEGWFNLSSNGILQGLFSTQSSAGDGTVGFGIRFEGPGISGVIGNGGTQTVVTTTTNPATGTWNHVAFVRNGSALTLYVNGISVATGTSSASIGVSGAAIGRYYANLNAYYLNGYASNIRVTNTAVYTANFTPSTTPLTAITGTQLLTCQNATFVDNSTNAITITNNSATTDQTYPFTMLAGQSKDYSPAGNNWTNNNIGVLPGSNLDVMTDVPTLTSTTAANYATFNPLISISGWNFVTLSNGNLTSIGNSASNNGVSFSTQAVKTGKWYVEFTCAGVNSTYPIVGITDITQLGTAGGTPGYTSNSVGYSANGSKILVNGTQSAYGNSYTTNDVIGVAVDADNGAVYFSKNGTFQNSGVPTSGSSKTGAAYTYTGGTIDFYISASAYQSSSGFNANFGQRPFSYTPPSGFLPLNTFNL
jgi:hypothetical protein